MPRPPAPDAKITKAIREHIEQSIDGYKTATEPIASIFFQSLDNFASAWGVTLTPELRADIVIQMGKIFAKNPGISQNQTLIEAFTKACGSQIHASILGRITSFLGEEE